jgi:hypothetical protein
VATQKEAIPKGKFPQEANPNNVCFNCKVKLTCGDEITCSDECTAKLNETFKKR